MPKRWRNYSTAADIGISARCYPAPMRRVLSAALLVALTGCSGSAAPPVATNTLTTNDVAAANATRAAAILSGSSVPAIASPSPVASAVAGSAPSPISTTAVAVEVEKVLFVPTSQGFVAAAALIKNPSADQYLPSTSLTATAYDAGGAVLGNNNLTVISLSAGEERWFAIETIPAPGSVAKVDVRLDATAKLKPANADPQPKVSLVQSTFQPSGSTGKQVGQIKNESAKTVSYVGVDVIQFNAAGALLAATTTVVQNIGPGETASFSAGPFLISEPPTDTKTYPLVQLVRLAS